MAVSKHGRNRLLESILDDCRLQEWAESVEFPVGHELASPGDSSTHFYFPTFGVLSTVISLREGQTAQTLTIGNEGMVGVPVWLGVRRSSETVLQQMPGEIIRIPARIFCQRIVGRRRTERLLKRFTAYSLRFASQSAVCNSHHNVGQRVSRWLLTMADRAGSARLKTTQSLLAHMLGVRRQSVTGVARHMQRSGLINYQRGQIQIVDQKGLTTSACECYGEMKVLYDSLVRTVL